jgi:hypothetical protein
MAAYTHTLENSAVGTYPGAVGDIDWCTGTILIDLPGVRIPSVVVIDERATRGDQHSSPDSDFFASIEFATSSDEHAVANQDRWPRHPEVIVVKENIRLENAPMSEADLMGPSNQCSPWYQSAAPDVSST